MGCLLKAGGGLHARLAVGAVLLAAGEGRRMGGVAKPLIRLQGVPLVTRLMVALSGAGVDEVAVVTGHAAAAVGRELEAFPVTLVHNPDPAAGQQTSVRLGLQALSARLDAILVVLADQPLIGSADLVELIAAFKKRPHGSVLVPVVDGVRGNPVVLDAGARDDIIRSESGLGCRHFIERNPALVYAYASGNRHYLIDLDTAEDVAALAARTGWQLVLPQ